MKYVLAWQKDGEEVLHRKDIPRGMEDAIDKMITGQKVVRFKDGLTLRQEEIKGIFTEAEFDRFEYALFHPFTPGPGYKEFLEMHQAMKEGKPLDKWKKKKSTNVLPVTDPSGLQNPMSSSSSTTNG